MIKLDLKTRKKRNYNETVDVFVFHADEDNTLSLSKGWYIWTEDLEGVKKEECGILTLAFLPNECYRRFIRDEALKHKKKFRKGRVTGDDTDKIDIEAVAKFGLKDWAGFGDLKDGVETAYTWQKGSIALWNDRDLLDLTCDLCRDEELFGNDKEGDAEAIKN